MELEGKKVEKSGDKQGTFVDNLDKNYVYWRIPL